MTTKNFHIKNNYDFLMHRCTGILRCRKKSIMADQTKLKKRIDALLKLPDNQVCADCRKRGCDKTFFLKNGLIVVDYE